jgi:hypothetical protein
MNRRGLDGEVESICDPMLATQNKSLYHFAQASGPNLFPG